MFFRAVQRCFSAIPNSRHSWASVKKKVDKKSTECQQKSEKTAFSQWKSQKKSEVNQSKLLVALVNVDLVKKKPQNGALIAGSSQSQLK